MKIVTTSAFIILLNISLFSQNKKIVAIDKFAGQSSIQKNIYSDRNTNNSQDKNIIAIQDLVSNAFLSTKRFTLVEREKMDLIKKELNTQKSEDFIDGFTVEQSKSLGADYLITGNVLEASFEEKQIAMGRIGGLSIANKTAKISFNIKVTDVSTGENMASENFSADANGKNGYDEALQIIKPNIEKFIKDNFKIILSIAGIEEKNAANEAIKVLISGGSSMGLIPHITLKVYEIKYVTVDNKKIPRKTEVGQIVVEKVEDENFSICKVTTGGSLIASKSEAGVNLKCEIISE